MSDTGKMQELLSRLHRGASIDLLELESVEGPEIILPNRRAVRVRLFDGEHYQLYERLQRNPNDEDAERLVRFAIPDVTDEEIRSLSPIMAAFIGKAAARQADAMLWVLQKNAERPVQQPPALAEPSKPQLSTRKTKPSTASRGSRGSSARRAGSGP